MNLVPDVSGRHSLTANSPVLGLLQSFCPFSHRDPSAMGAGILLLMCQLELSFSILHFDWVWFSVVVGRLEALPKGTARLIGIGPKMIKIIIKTKTLRTWGLKRKNSITWSRCLLGPPSNKRAVISE